MQQPQATDQQHLYAGQVDPNGQHQQYHSQQLNQQQQSFRQLPQSHFPQHNQYHQQESQQQYLQSQLQQLQQQSFNQHGQLQGPHPQQEQMYLPQHVQPQPLQFYQQDPSQVQKQQYAQPLQQGSTPRSQHQRATQEQPSSHPTYTENLSLPELLAKSEDGSRQEGRRVYAQRGPMEQDAASMQQLGQAPFFKNEAYARQFDAAAGSRSVEVRSNSVKVYSDAEQSKLYEGHAGAKQNIHPSSFETRRRRFPAAGVSMVDGLLRNSNQPLVSEHPTQYEQFYVGAAGNKAHWLLSRQQDQAYAMPHSARGAGPSQIDDIILGRDIDGSVKTFAEQMKLDGAAGCRSMGASPRTERKRNVQTSSRVDRLDELVFGRDIDNSLDPAFIQANNQLYQGAAGSKSSGTAVRTEGKRHHAVDGNSEVEALVFGKQADASSQKDSLLQQEFFIGAAGHHAFAQRPEGKKHLLAPAQAFQVDDVILGTDLDNSMEALRQELPEFEGAAGQRGGGEVRQEGKRHIEAFDLDQVGNLVSGSAGASGQVGRMPALEGAAGRKCVGATPRSEGRRHLAFGAASKVDEVLWSRDIDGSVETLAGPHPFEGAAGIHAVGFQSRGEGKRHHPAAQASQLDELVWGRDIDGSSELRARRQQQAELEGAAGRQCVGATDRPEGRRYIPTTLAHIDEIVWGRNMDQSERGEQWLQSEAFNEAAGCPSLSQKGDRNGLDRRLYDQALIPDSSYQAPTTLEIGVRR
eukprot:TRINITY_DN7993_c0_g1_i1.p1 TRINITY_DN7993_c0_g1~~TRINITY_DN7993_c0_g1_i1.p1  ORF type:complete len:747 (-),score=164.18 TRINITY_DN7993_c0_g1_i1:72-2312(-)